MPALLSIGFRKRLLLRNGFSAGEVLCRFQTYEDVTWSLASRSTPYGPGTDTRKIPLLTEHAVREE